ncbi:hypothetical protein CXG81DRAFT_21408, partial [Caulochytrium protostelioides]
VRAAHASVLKGHAVALRAHDVGLADAIEQVQTLTSDNGQLLSIQDELKATLAEQTRVVTLTQTRLEAAQRELAATETQHRKEIASLKRIEIQLIKTQTTHRSASRGAKTRTVDLTARVKDLECQVWQLEQQVHESQKGMKESREMAAGHLYTLKAERLVARRVEAQLRETCADIKQTARSRFAALEKKAELKAIVGLRNE